MDLCCEIDPVKTNNNDSTETHKEKYTLLEIQHTIYGEPVNSHWWGLDVDGACNCILNNENLELKIICNDSTMRNSILNSDFISIYQYSLDYSVGTGGSRTYKMMNYFPQYYVINKLLSEEKDSLKIASHKNNGDIGIEFRGKFITLSNNSKAGFVNKYPFFTSWIQYNIIDSLILINHGWTERSKIKFVEHFYP
jgi:hypothetical protein